MPESLRRRFSTPTQPDEPRIEAGTTADLKPLARFHYASGRPGPVSRVLRAVADGETIGVLVASMPTLNGRWRRLAWPGAYDTPDHRANARRLNRDVRVISRVIIDPRWRGRGVAVALVRRYLSDHATRRTEALAAMAHACPFFERAGMRRIELPPCKADARLLGVLDGHGLAPPDLLNQTPDRINGALRAWARARKIRGCNLEARAFAALTCPPLAFVHDRGGS